MISHVKWLTWSAPARRLLSRFGAEAEQLPSPKHIRLLGGLEFDHTYSIPMADIRRLDCFPKLEQMGMALRSQQPEDGLILFRELLDDKFAGEHLHKLFACLREILAESTGKILGALYAPLSYVGRKAGDFPLHADLYVPDLLWNVFDRVPTDGSGMATLLPILTFRELLQEAQTPLAERKVLLSCLEDDSLEDRFRTFYDLLYVNGADWTDRLTALMTQRQFRLPLGYGQGYLINDRNWLHGREAPAGGVTTKRVHRLVFFGV
jgi:hypothetical protein